MSERYLSSFLYIVSEGLTVTAGGVSLSGTQSIMDGEHQSFCVCSLRQGSPDVLKICSFGCRRKAEGNNYRQLEKRLSSQDFVAPISLQESNIKH